MAIEPSPENDISPVDAATVKPDTQINGIGQTNGNGPEGIEKTVAISADAKTAATSKATVKVEAAKAASAVAAGKPAKAVGGSAKTPAVSGAADPKTKTVAGAPTAKALDAKTGAAKAADPKAADTKSGDPKTGAAKEKPAQKSARKGPKAQASVREEFEELEKVGKLPLIMVVPSWLISAIVHMVILLIFGLLVMPEKDDDNFKDIVALPSQKTEELEEELPLDTPLEIDPNTVSVSQVESATSSDIPEATPVDDEPAPEATMVLEEIGLAAPSKSDLMTSMGVVGGQGLDGRGEAARAALAASRGGNEASENAVALALAWLAEHQTGDGSWSFDHRGFKCQGRCSKPGTLKEANMAATGMALLPFLGAGQTHKQGKYKDNVKAGLYYLGTHMQVSQNGGDMTAGGSAMYGHGIASIALCEAYAMTQDKALLQPAQLALNFIMYAQDPVGGGWRYGPRQPGDTSVVGWQIMALKSGHLGYLQVNPNTVKGAMNFLNTVQADGGASYGYTGPGNGPATSAVGLLCRMHLGWKHEEPALQRGVQMLANIGPQPGNLYFDYYATQVLHHYEGELWDAWNVKMRDFLTGSQSKNGHEVGSWLLEGDHGSEVGGRVYCTSMATMILEVYYRHMPIYAKKSTEDVFED